MNYYELFEIAESPLIDKRILSKKMIALQKKYHPDFFTNENEADKEHALQQSAAINTAYKIFSNTDKTLEYFLIEKGIISPNEKYNLPPDFLMEMIDLNEGIDEKDESVLTTISLVETNLTNEVKDLLNRNNFNEIELQILKAYYYKKKYLKRILDRLAD